VVDRHASRRALRTSVVWAALRAALDQQAARLRRPALDVVDAGGGTGGFAVPLAQLGHRVTVVDPSPDSLAALERRVAEAGVAQRVHAVQGDAAGLRQVVAADSADAVLCHSVLEYVDDPAQALAAVAAVLRAGGLASVVAANRTAAVLGRAVAGRFAEASRALDDPAGRWGDADAVARRFTLPELVAVLEEAGFAVAAAHGVRVFADLVSDALLDGDGAALDTLLALESATAERPEFRDIATALHVLATRG
jgi:SAM-dependent methyltransferase